MKRRGLLLLPLLFCSMVRAQDPATFAFNQIQTTGMVGVALNQTARLNVLNSAMPPPAANPVAPPPCKVTLQIFDDQNTKLAELTVDNLEPGTAKRLDYPKPGPTPTASAPPLRIEVRGVVTFTNTLSSILSPGAPVFPQPVTPQCSVLPTLEVFDN